MNKPVVLVALCCLFQVDAGRTTYNLDLGWKFSLNDQSQGSCSSVNYTIDMTNKQCPGLLCEASVATYADCLETCCNAKENCNVFQFNPTMPSASQCWYGYVSDLNSCPSANGWQSKARIVPPPEPTPPEGPCNTTECHSSTDDSSWRTVNVPHDFVVEGKFIPTASKSAGYLSTDIAWYRRHFTMPAGSSGKSVWLDFDGALHVSQVWLNDQYLGTWQVGYIPFRFQLGLGSNVSVNWSGDNVLAVRIDSSQATSRSWWYDGGGLYRHVSITVVEPVHVGRFGVYAPAVVTGAISGSSADAVLHATVEVENSGSDSVTVTVTNEVFDPSGKSVATGSNSTGSMGPNQMFTVATDIQLPSALLWGVGYPNLYTLVTTLTHAGSQIDAVNTTFGVRKIVFDADRGFFLNDQPTKIKGNCNHQDFAGVGAAVPDSLQYYRVFKMLEMGGNGWRTAHNAPTPALLDAADKLGMVVWDENHIINQYDMMELLVKRDRNHPSVVIWSMCNEVLCSTKDEEGDIHKDEAIVMQFDPLMGRPVSSNRNPFDHPGTYLTLVGVDYSSGSYASYHSKNPTVPLIGSEDSSAVSDRGEYANDPVTGHVTGYDTQWPGWGGSAESVWGAIMTTDFVSGGFTWTGFDYKGEPTPYGWPNINSHFGTLDIAGFKKDRAFWYEAWWKQPEVPALYIFPHWNWAVNHTEAHRVPCKGMCKLTNDAADATVMVWAYSNAPGDIELFLNDQSMGRQANPAYKHLEWKVPFAAGTLRAVAYRNNTNTVVATYNVTTTGPAASLRISIKDGIGANGLFSDGDDTALIMVELVDAAGIVVPTASHNVTFDISAPGVFIGGGNGDPSCQVNDKSLSRPAYHGLLLGVVQAQVGATGTITVTASAAGFPPASLQIAVNAPLVPVPRL